MALCIPAGEGGLVLGAQAAPAAWRHVALIKDGLSYVVVVSGHRIIGGQVYAADSPYTGNDCDVDGIASPDNLTFIPGHDTLIIGEDTDHHQNDAIWAMNLSSGALTRIATTPYGSEATSVDWYPNVNGHGYLVAIVQHPYGETDADKLAAPSDANAYVGYFGPFPAVKQDAGP